MLLELWVIRHEWRDDWEAWAIWDFVGITRFPSIPPVSKFVVEVASVLLIGIGIAGELSTGIKIARINGDVRGKSAELRSKGDELRSDSDRLLALVTQQAGDAKDSAQRARDAAKQAWEYAAWRTIPDKECKVIRKAASALHNRTMVVEVNPSDDEGLAFANRINSCLGTIGTATAWQPGMMLPTGLSFSVGKDRHADFEIVIHALELGGVGRADEMRKRSDDRAQADFLLLVVGPRH